MRHRVEKELTPIAAPQVLRAEPAARGEIDQAGR
jgi:hypothetical protein